MKSVKFLKCVVDLNDNGDYDFWEANPEGIGYYAFNWVNKGICKIMEEREIGKIKDNNRGVL